MDGWTGHSPENTVANDKTRLPGCERTTEGDPRTRHPLLVLAAPQPSQMDAAAWPVDKNGKHHHCAAPRLDTPRATTLPIGQTNSGTATLKNQRQREGRHPSYPSTAQTRYCCARIRRCLVCLVVWIFRHWEKQVSRLAEQTRKGRLSHISRSQAPNVAKISCPKSGFKILVPPLLPSSESIGNRLFVRLPGPALPWFIKVGR
jgi:hypothetical protein